MNSLIVFLTLCLAVSAIPLPDDLKNAKDAKVTLTGNQKVILKDEISEEKSDTVPKIPPSSIAIRPIPLRLPKPALPVLEDSTIASTEAEFNADKDSNPFKAEKPSATSEQSVPKPIRGQRASTTTPPTAAV